MKRSFRFLLLSATIATISIPVLAASCETKAPKEKKEFEAEIAKVEESIKDTTLSAGKKVELAKLASDAKLQLDKLKTQEDFKKALEDLKQKADEIKNKQEENNEGNEGKKPAEISELDETSKKLKDILVLSNDGNRDKWLALLTKSEKDYTLWYDRDNKKIVMVKGEKPPFGSNKDAEQWVLFELKDDAKGMLTDGRQLVNDKEPTYEVAKGDKTYTNLSTKLNFGIDKQLNSNKFDIYIRYKVGKFIKDASPLVSTESNQSKVSFETKESEESTPSPSTPPSSTPTPDRGDSSSPAMKYKMPELYKFSEEGNLFEVKEIKQLKEELEKILKGKNQGSLRIDKGLIKATRDKKSELKFLKFNLALKKFPNVNTHGNTTANIGWIFGSSNRKGIFLKKEDDNKYILKWKLLIKDENTVSDSEKEYSQIIEIK
ncbi:Hypothetical protein, predicted lipoprotein [Metamycoplasma auris 15026]|uniref:Lipoprotein n=1 Tax=Metamycoplasma auris 15026 TaxID=1188233 RepID=N9V1D9_9BACT|nr:variable surface lipoprotein [Metamycoplasma auris]ENY69182.1 Hypothetical protein, predicted lipoprotein [Metamycoplasma auris 15026]